MFNWFLLLSIFFITAKAVEFTFTPDYGRLAKCIEYYLLIDPHITIGDKAGNISKIISRKFFDRSFTSDYFYKATNNAYYTMKSGKSNAMFEGNKVPDELRLGIRRALENCVERKNLPALNHVERKNLSALNCAERKNLPVFENELKVLAELLDYVLVDWPIPVGKMISTREGRSTLRLYAYSAGVKLMSALRYFSMDFKLFSNGLRRIWSLRAYQYFDHRDTEFPYIRSRFTTDRDRMYSSIPLEDIHTIDNVHSFALRRSQDFSSRNPIIKRWNANLLSNILEAGSYYQSRNGFFESFSVSAADFYLQDHLDQCYQIILFILELQLRNINTDEDDIYNGPVPSDVMPLPIQEIAWNREAYQNYLKYWAEHKDQLFTEELKECRTKEELIMQLSLFILKKKARNEFLSATTELPFHQEESEKGEVCEFECGECILPNKRFKTNFFHSDQQLNQTDNRTNHFGYITYNRDSDVGRGI